MSKPVKGTKYQSPNILEKLTQPSNYDIKWNYINKDKYIRNIGQ